VFFVTGMFGSAIEHVVRSYSNELTPTGGEILPDGSMHSFFKLAHIGDLAELDKAGNTAEVSTLTYPFKNHHLPEILTQFKKFSSIDDFYILVHAESIESAELNMLFQYHKISVGLSFGLEIFCGGNEHNITAWNPTYQNWSQMDNWQLREWISLFYVPWVQEWINSQHQVGHNFLTITNTELLFAPKNTFDRIFDHCKLTQKPSIEKFIQQWQHAQQYVVNEFELIEKIVTSAINNQMLQWEPINIIAEAIVQQRLRAAGYELRCDGLNTFPTDIKTLYNLLEKC
jgi:hypothetical protein